VHAKSATGICGLLPYPCGLMSSWAFVLGYSVLGDFVLGAFVWTWQTRTILKPSTFGAHCFPVAGSTVWNNLQLDYVIKCCALFSKILSEI